ncbi:inorganic diphosphatase [Candidatus Legionella polyplacis]|uniref:Inorganic pyrophosphatase n=1 Tax=Candidatus Legionella polyplacis TaxID=2005262 RepID=A0ABZ2GWJ7_9GAMM
MNLTNINIGNKIPNEINVIIEIPMYSKPIKYEIDKKTETLFVDRFLSTSMCYPSNYGYIPNTLSEDGDPIDALVITPIPLVSCSVITCRPIGLLEMNDEKGIDIKILTVPITKITKYYKNIKSYKDLPENLLSSLKHFFQHYKDLEENKWVTIGNWKNKDSAIQTILNGIKNFKNIK